MSLSSIGLILLSSFFHALWNVLTQTSRKSNFLSGLKGIWIMGFALLFFLFSKNLHIPSEIYIWVVWSGILHGIYILSLSKAYESQDISYVYPIARSAPVFVPAFAWFFLGEQLTIISFLAIVTILLAVYILHFDGHLISGFKNLGEAVLHKDLRWAFITLILVVSYSLVDKRGMEIFINLSPDQKFLNGIIFFFLESFIGFTLCNVYLFARYPKNEILSEWKLDWKKGIIAGLATLGSYGLICVVLQFEPVGQVVAVRQTSVIMVVLWGVLRLREPFGKKRILAGFLTVLGVGLMAWDPN